MSRSRIGGSAVREEIANRRRVLAAPKERTSDGQPDSPVGDAMASPTGEPARLVPVDEISRHPLNPRGEVVDGIDELAASVRELGILQPLLVASRDVFTQARPKLNIPDSAKWVLIAGERRLAAARLAGLRQIPVVSGDHLVSGGTDVEAMVVENVQRESLTPIQEARAYAALITEGSSQRLIARRVGRAQSHVTRRVRLLRLPIEAHAALDSGDLPIKDAETLTELPDDLITQGWSAYMARPAGRKARDIVSAVTEQERRTKAAATSVERAHAEGVTLLDHVRWAAVLDDPAMIDAARIAGNLAAAVTEDGRLVYIDTSLTDRNSDSDVERRTRDSERRRTNTTRRKFAATIATARPPTATALTDRLAAYVLSRASADSLRLAAQWLAPDSDDHYEWRANIQAGTPGERRQAAWALVIADQDLAISSEHIPLTPHGADYLSELQGAGYEPTAYDQDRLDQLTAAGSDEDEDLR